MPAPPDSPGSRSGQDALEVLPDVNPLLKCPICLDEIEDHTTALNCGHGFCYECISHWILQRNRCPLCRAVIGRICHKVTPASGGTPVDHFEDVPVPVEQQGFIMNLGFLTMVHTPFDSPLHVVQPMPCPRSLRIRYAVRRLDADHTYFLAGVEPGTLWVLPEDLARVCEVLESYGITAIEPGTHQQVGPRAGHSTFLDIHDNHHRSHDRGSGGSRSRSTGGSSSLSPKGGQADEVD